MTALASESEHVGLHDAHASSRLPIYLREVAERRSYIWHVSVSELHHRQVTNVLGNLWHLLNPALTIGVYYLIFGLLLKTSRGVDDFLLFLTIGLFAFQFTQKATIDGARSVVGNKGLIRAVRFPRVLLPISSSFTELLALGPNLFVMYVVALLSGVAPSLTWPLIVPVLLAQSLFNLGAAMIAARTATHFADTLQILPFVFRLVLYASGVIFSVDAYVASDSWTHWLFILNPVYCFITLSRWTVLGGAFPMDLAVSGSLWAIAILIVGFWWFRSGEELYARD